MTARDAATGRNLAYQHPLPVWGGRKRIAGETCSTANAGMSALVSPLL